MNGIGLLFKPRVRGVLYMQKEVTLRDFFQRRLKSLDEMMREAMKKPDGIGEQNRLMIREHQSS